MERNETAAGFKFGENWSKLVPQLDDARLESSKSDIIEMMERDTLEGLSFLDIGSGSGLHSLAAYRLGAAPIVSVDLDPLNIENLQALRRQAGVPDDADWTARPGSIVDAADVASLPKSDVVYSWGVLHHTGQMWNAIDNAASLVNPGGYLHIMLYRDAVLAGAWTRIKRFFVRAPGFVQWLMQAFWASFLFVALLLRGRNPIRVIRDYPKTSRGMSWWIDIRDWIGGYPFEVAAARDVIDFLKERGFEIQKMQTGSAKDPFARPIGLKGTGSICYLFKRA